MGNQKKLFQKIQKKMAIMKFTRSKYKEESKKCDRDHNIQIVKKRDKNTGQQEISIRDSSDKESQQKFIND